MERYTIIDMNDDSYVCEFVSDAEESIVSDVVQLVGKNINYDKNFDTVQKLIEILQAMGWKVNKIEKKANVFRM